MWQRSTFADLVDPPVIGMVHLAPLPDAPDWGGDLDAVVAAALEDADALVAGGAGAAMIENFNDAPFHPGRVPPVTVAALTVVAGAVRRRHPALPLGINVLRNDAEAALAVAFAVGARFLRVNVHVGAAVTDQGLVEGRAWETLRLRRRLGAAVGILADVRVKHAAPLSPRPLEEELADLRGRGRADAVIVSGAATGRPADPETLRRAREALPDCPLLVGSGADPGGVARYGRWADGYIVGTALQVETEGGRRVVEAEKVRAFVAAVAEAHTPERKGS
jgi:membrane complex biogenesis BtpA family protein